MVSPDLSYLVCKVEELEQVTLLKKILSFHELKRWTMQHIPSWRKRGRGEGGWGGGWCWEAFSQVPSPTDWPAGLSWQPGLESRVGAAAGVRARPADLVLVKGSAAEKRRHYASRKTSRKVLQVTVVAVGKGGEIQPVAAKLGIKVLLQNMEVPKQF